jgi:hypothetical protein
MFDSQEISRKISEHKVADINEADISIILQNEIRNQGSKLKLDVDGEIFTKPLITEANITGTTINSLNFTKENDQPTQSFTSASLKGKKIFKIKKYIKYNKYLSEICSEEELSDTDKNVLKDPKSKKISPFSKVNFSKLKTEEKDERLKNLAKLVKRLRRKVRNLENKVRFDATKLLNKHIWNKLGINTKNKYLKPEFQFDFEKIHKALRKLRNYQDFEFDDHKHIIENIINLIAEDKLKPSSLLFRKICSMIRQLIPKEKVKALFKNDQNVTLKFPDIELLITSKEYAEISKYSNNEDLVRTIYSLKETDISSSEIKGSIVHNFTSNISQPQDFSTIPQNNLNMLLRQNDSVNNNLFSNPQLNHAPNNISNNFSDLFGRSNLSMQLDPSLAYKNLLMMNMGQPLNSFSNVNPYISQQLIDSPYFLNPGQDRNSQLQQLVFNTLNSQQINPNFLQNFPKKPLNIKNAEIQMTESINNLMKNSINKNSSSTNNDKNLFIK